MNDEIANALNAIPGILKILEENGDLSEKTIRAYFARYLEYLHRDCSLITIAYITGYMEGLLNKNHSSEILRKTSKKGIAFLEGNLEGLKNAQNYPMLGNIGNAKAIEDDEQEHD